ncbi:hypothetical protein ES703_116998 [subsurface metagenome]
MRIDNWPIDRIMRLPDWCFGRRYVISATAFGAVGAQGWDISELSFPEVCVIWSLSFWASRVSPDVEALRIAMGTQLPTAVGMMDVLDPIFPGLGFHGAEPRQIEPALAGLASGMFLRMPLEPRGRNLIIEVSSVAEKNGSVIVALVVSAMPREVPDWLISAQAINL